MLDETSEWTAIEVTSIVVILCLGIAAIRLAAVIAATIGSEDLRR